MNNLIWEFFKLDNYESAGAAFITWFLASLGIYMTAVFGVIILVVTIFGEN